jgi:transposase
MIKVHLVAANERTALCCSLWPGQVGDAPEGRKLLSCWGSAKPSTLRCMIMDRAYDGNETQQLLFSMEVQPVVPPNPNRLNRWEYDKELYKKRNEVERLFR